MGVNELASSSTNDIGSGFSIPKKKNKDQKNIKNGGLIWSFYIQMK